MADRNTELSAHVLLTRRATMRVDMARVKELAALPWADAVTALVEAPADGQLAPTSGESDDLVRWWMGRMVLPESGLTDRMAFFWHTVLTTHRYAAGYQQLVGPQLNLLRRNALGNFRTLLQEFCVDGALIMYLNANGSTAEHPNENLARELMELFTTGVGHYTEADVRAAARAMTGWQVEDGSYTVRFDPARASTEPVAFLGETKQWDVASIVDRLCDHPATAARIAGRLWYHLVGTELSGPAAADLGAWWQGQQLEIKPLVTRILNDPEVRAEHYRRPRSGYEWYLAFQHVTGADLAELWIPRHLGQALYEPPNVAGWPVGERWLDADSVLRRTSLSLYLDMDKIPGGATATVDDVLDRCGLVVVSDATVDALTRAGEGTRLDDASLAHLRWSIALSSPEFQLT